MDAALGTYDRGHAHGRTGVARVGLEGGVHLRGLSACVLVVLEELWYCAESQHSTLSPSIGAVPNKRTARVRMVLMARVSVLS